MGDADVAYQELVRWSVKRRYHLGAEGVDLLERLLHLLGRRRWGVGAVVDGEQVLGPFSAQHQ
ncbi:MAG: hypothetical protein ACR2LQ_03075 [Acidimicrobiales bacterium]